MDPLTITTGVLTLLSTCITVSIELKKLKQGSADAGTTINALLSDVNGFRTVLQSMEITFEEVEKRDGFQKTGHIGSHWQNLNESLHDAYGSLVELETLAKSLNRSVNVLDGPRRHMRLQAATAQIAGHRQQIQTYRDAMQFSLQTIILYVGRLSLDFEIANVLQLELNVNQGQHRQSVAGHRGVGSEYRPPGIKFGSQITRSSELVLYPGAATTERSHGTFERVREVSCHSLFGHINRLAGSPGSGPSGRCVSIWGSFFLGAQSRSSTMAEFPNRTINECLLHYCSHRRQPH